MAAGEYVPPEEATQLQQYAYSIDIDMAPDGYRYVSRNCVPLLGLGSLEVFTEPDNPQLLSRCAVWYRAVARAKWLRRGGKYLRNMHPHLQHPGTQSRPV